jgi:hypothetical protein
MKGGHEVSNWLRSLLAATGVMTVLVALLASPALAGEGGDLAAVRKATAPFHSVERANHAGYFAALACFDLPGVGGMGQHLIKGALMNGTVTPTQPQALVYEVDGDELTLVAVEYIIPYTFVPPTAEPPRLFGQSFLHNNGLRLWALHAWIWRHNPLGTFANYNPRVALCPGHGDD